MKTRRGLLCGLLNYTLNLGESQVETGNNFNIFKLLD